MRYYMPVRVFDEPQCVKAHAGELCSYGKKALIVTGRRSAFSNGSFDDVAGALKNGQVDFEVFSEIEENPSVETVFEAKNRFSESGIDFVIGIGGGSPMDAAKAIALVLAHTSYTPEDLYDAAKDASSLPVICVPTTCGTGSEVTGVSVLTRHDKKTKISMVHKVFPVCALIDGKYLRSASSELIASSSIDALSHMYESLFCKKTDDYVRMTATAGLRMWAKIKDCVSGKRHPTDDDCSLMMRSSALAGMSIAQSGTSLPHALSYALTYDLGLAHGKAVGFFLPSFLAAAPEIDRLEVLGRSGFFDLREFDAFIKGSLNLPDVPKSELERAYELVKSNPAKMNSASFPVDEDILRRIVFN